MQEGSRGLRDSALRILAGLGLLLALAVMAIVFAVPAAQGDRDDDLYLSSTDTNAASTATHAKRTDGGSTAPSAIGVLLGVLVLGAGVTVLALGARRPEPEPETATLLPPN